LLAGTEEAIFFGKILEVYRGHFLNQFPHMLRLTTVNPTEDAFLIFAIENTTKQKMFLVTNFRGTKLSHGIIF